MLVDSEDRRWEHGQREAKGEQRKGFLFPMEDESGKEGRKQRKI